MSRPGRALISLVSLLTWLSIRLAVGQLSNYNGTEHLVSNSKAAVLSDKAIELMDKGDNASARKYFDAAVREDPGSYILYFNRAIYFNKTHQWQLALKDLSSCLRLKPTFLNAVVMRAAVNKRLGNFRDSLADYNALLKVYQEPAFFDFRAWLFATCPDAAIRNGQAAIDDATAACKSSVWDDPTYIDTLAAAYAESHDFDSAIRFEEKAIAKAHKMRRDTADMDKRLALYHQHQPFRDVGGESSRTKLASAKAKKHG